MDSIFQQLFNKYARLVVKTGVNIQPGQVLVISSPIECAEFARSMAEAAYLEGARDVVMKWNDELSSKLRYLHAPEDVFEQFPQWEKELYLLNANNNAAFISIAASDPELMRDVEAERLSKASRSRSTALREYYDRIISNRNTWCVASVPTVSWARKVFPGVDADTAVEKLWNLIFQAVRVDAEDPVAAWDIHKNQLKQRLDFLNASKFKMLHYQNSAGTDLTIELPEEHIWLGGADKTPEGVEFIANMPTEEVFTLPFKYGVNGRVVSTMPLNYLGKLIENFSFTFKDGKVVEMKAEKEYDALKKMLETDENSAYLGEVALVPYHSPISNTKVLFYNTLFDENASCHLALGEAYPVCLKNGENMTKDELEKAGVNSSLNHEDFMIGSEDLNITGVTAEGKKVPIFVNGNWA
ncbi:MAG: aminopeptidase [Thermoclostridium sp.]|nr:aminopeptidase [Thermoclostridium sp.]